MGFILNNSGTLVLNGSSPTGATLRISGWGTFTSSGTVDLGTNGYGYITGAGTSDVLCNYGTIQGAGQLGPGLVGIYNGGSDPACQRKPPDIKRDHLQLSRHRHDLG